MISLDKMPLLVIYRYIILPLAIARHMLPTHEQTTQNIKQKHSTTKLQMHAKHETNIKPQQEILIKYNNTESRTNICNCRVKTHAQ